MELDVVDVQILLELMSRKDEDKRPNKIAEALQIKDYDISRRLKALADAGLVDREHQRKPKLTDTGIKTARKLNDRVEGAAKILMAHGLEKAEAYDYALKIAVTFDDKLFGIFGYLKDLIEIARIKDVVANRTRFSGKLLEKDMAVGEYPLDFTLYKLAKKKKSDEAQPMELNEKNIFSMANRGFEHPAKLVVAEDQAYVVLTLRDMDERSQSTGKLMRGRLKKLEYHTAKGFVCAFDDDGGSYVKLPLAAFEFTNISGSDKRQAKLHGTLLLGVECTTGIGHMPHSFCMLDIVM